MKDVIKDISQNPSFSTVTGLINTTFNPNSIVEGRMATEDQVNQIALDIADLEQRNDNCCRDIVVWRSYVRVVAENTGIVVSDWLNHYNTGTARRGKPFTIEFSLPHDETKYYMNRSQPRSNYTSFLYAFGFHINSSGKAAMADTVFKTRIGQAFNGTSSPSFTESDDYLTNDGTNSKLQPTGVLPAGSDNGYYYFYKDSTTNKIKIDVRIANKIGNNEYFCIALTQFVLKAGQTM